MVKVNSVVSLLALGSGALAFERNAQRGLVEEFITCTTELGPKSTNHVPTNWHYKTKTLTYTEKVTVTPHPVVTPTKTATKTFTHTVSTVLSEPTPTDVLSTTLTRTKYATATNVVTQTDITTVDTTITTTPTTTIPAPADFTPVSQNQDYVAKVKARSAKNLLERGKEVVQCKKNPKGGHSFYPPLYPQSVTCNKLVEPVVYKRVTVTAKPSTITAVPTTKTLSTTVTTTHTNTVWPADITSTITFGTSVTVTSTIDSTTTNYITASNTYSAVAPEQTFNAVCGADNIISSANGGGDISIQATAPDYLSLASATDSYSCCMACQDTAACRGSFFYPGGCYLVVNRDGVCNANQFQAGSGYFNEQGTIGSVSNGPCGLLSNLGDHNSINY
ncbi:hypothetical protein HDV63DRAFT_412172 [Trichoderma sp. SZMC 28014]